MRSSGKPLAQTSRELDVLEQTLRNWRKRQEIDEGERKEPATEEREAWTPEEESEGPRTRKQPS